MHLCAPLVCLGIEALVLSGVAVHARVRSARRSDEERTIAAVSRLLPAADLALAGAARHLRFPSQEEPGAAFADGPASFDLDPAGGALAPPIDVYSSIETRQPRKRAPRPLGSEDRTR